MDNFTTKLEKFFGGYKLRTYRRGDIILHEEDTPNGVYYIKNGVVKLYSYSPEGDELIRIILGPGDLFPIRWTLSQEPIDFYLEPMNQVDCWYAPRQDFLNLIRNDSELDLALEDYIVKRMGTLYKRMEFFAFGDAYQKIISILVFLEKRFGKKEGDFIKIDVPITQSDLGALVGMARETTNEELEKLKKQGIIEWQEHHIIIKDLKKLCDNSPFITAV